MWDTFIKYSTALLTPVIGLTTLYIAVQQWRLERQKWKLSLYEKRFETFKIVTDFINHNCSNWGGQHAEQVAFLQQSTKNRFLFGKEIHDYISELYRQSVNLSGKEQSLNTLSPQAPDSYRETLAKESSEILRWFSDQYLVAESKFGYYLRISSPTPIFANIVYWGKELRGVGVKILHLPRRP